MHPHLCWPPLGVDGAKTTFKKKYFWGNLPRTRILRCDPSSTYEFPDNKQCFNIPLRLCFPAFRMWKVKSTPAEAFWTARSKHGRGMRTEKKIPRCLKKHFGICCTHFENALLSSIWLRWEPWPPTLNQLAKLTQFYVNIDSISFSVQKILYFGLHVEYRDGWPHQNGWIFGKVTKGLWPPLIFGKSCCTFSSNVILKKPCLKVQNLQYKFLDWKWVPPPSFGTFLKIHPIW